MTTVDTTTSTGGSGTNRDNDNNNNELEPRAVTRDLFSATIGSVASCYVGQPFDTIKVRMQTNPEQFSGVYTSTTSILRNEVRGKVIAKKWNDDRSPPRIVVDHRVKTVGRITAFCMHGLER
jgi:hypothetical protein